MSTIANVSLPDTVVVRKGLAMSFLRGEKYLVRVTITGEPDSELFYVPPHWHETHDEFLRVVEGKLQVTINGIANIYSPEDGEIAVKKGTPHELLGLKGVRCILEERTEPRDTEKELFFRNAIDIMKNGGTRISQFISIMHTSYYGDVIVSFSGSFKRLEKMFVAFFGFYVARLLGYERKIKTL